MKPWVGVIPRFFQGIFAAITLGLCAAIIKVLITDYERPAYALAVAGVDLVYCVLLCIPAVAAKTPKIVFLLAEALLVILWVVAFGLFVDVVRYLTSCTITYWYYYSYEIEIPYCPFWKGATAFTFIGFFLHLATFFAYTSTTISTGVKAQGNFFLKTGGLAPGAIFLAESYEQKSLPGALPPDLESNANQNEKESEGGESPLTGIGASSEGPRSQV